MQQVKPGNGLSCQTVRATVTVLLILAAPTAKAAGIISVDPAVLLQMQETVRLQQDQLELQAKQLKLQAQRMEVLKQQVSDLQQSLPSSTPVTSAPPPDPATASNNRIKLAISGQINRALNLADDGSTVRLYHVDNNASNSRFRLVGSVQITDDLILGTRIETAISPDNSALVSQINQSPGVFINQRWAEVSLSSRTFGKLSLGKGNTASKGTVAQDLSHTNVVQYVGVIDIASGMLFRKADAQHSLTTIKVGNTFSHRDGLGRHARLRYDSPSLLGFTLAGALVSEQRSDLGLYWKGQGYGFKGVGAMAVANPRRSDSGLLYDGSFSLLHIASGLNLTVSGGIQKRYVAQDQTNLYAKLGWIADFTGLGSTAFGVDYTNSGNMPTSNDRAYSVGGAVVQAFEKYASELYFQYRIYSLKQGSGVPLDDIQVSTLGVRVKF